MNWFRKFMMGRYGVDQFSTFLITIGLLLLIVNIFVKTPIINTITMILLIYSYFRVFSKSINKRYQENMKFLNATKPIRTKTNKIKKKIKTMKTHKYYKCPECNQELRVPKGKGKITVKCPKCSHKFVRRT